MFKADSVLLQSNLVSSSAVIENLRRQKAVGMEKWLKEQQEIWGSEWYLKRWIWLQKECENRLRRFKKEDTG